jgi:uncharacterized membrane protein YfcA
VNLLLTLPLGLVVGLALGALGGGGSILAVPALVYIVGLSPKEAVTTSLAVVGVAAFGGMVGHRRAGRVRVVAGLWFSLAGVAGSLLGTRLNRAVNSDVLLATFAGVMVIAAWRMWVRARAQDRLSAAARSAASSSSLTTAATATSPTTSVSVPAVRPGATTVDGSSATTRSAPTGHRAGPKLSTVAKVVVAGTVVGFMTGFFGVGGGFIIVPALVLALGFDMSSAVGTSLLVIAINCAVALISRLATTGVDWRVAIPFTVAALAGAVAGNHLASRTRASTLLRSFASLLVVVATYTLARSVASL